MDCEGHPRHAFCVDVDPSPTGNIRQGKYDARGIQGKHGRTSRLEASPGMSRVYSSN